MAIVEEEPAFSSGIGSDAAPTSSDAADRAEGAEAPGPVTTEEPAEPEPARTPEEEEAAQAEASRLKGEANAAYTDGKLELAYDLYGQALALRPPDSKLQAVLLANRAACGLRLKEFESVVRDCSAALLLDPAYLKVYVRRAEAYERLDKLEEALSDHHKVVELDPGNRDAKARIAAIQPEVEARREKMKEEVVGKLKDLGNTMLGWFGLSLDNFKAQQDPATGSYSISFQQGPSSGSDTATQDT